MKNRIHIIFLALLLCLIPLNYGCSIIKVALKPASKGMFKKSFAKVSKYTGKYGKYVFGKGAKIFAKPSAEIKKLTGLAKDKYLKKQLELFYGLFIYFRYCYNKFTSVWRINQRKDKCEDLCLIRRRPWLHSGGYVSWFSII